MPDSNIPKAADIMTRKLVALRPDMSVLRAMRTLVENRISGAPVIDAHGELVGILSEYDCLRVLTSGQFSQDSYEEDERVGAIMTTDVLTIPPDLDLFSIAHRFLERRVRRLPVVEEGKVVGLVSRRDVLAGVDALRSQLRERPEDRPKGLYLSAADPAGDEIKKLLE